jgi:hypothetical protein
MTEITDGTWYYRWYPETTTLVASRNQNCFDAALEPSVRRFDVTEWIEVNGRTIPVIAINGHSKTEVLMAYVQAARQEVLS